jgi:hypothetical protein
MKPKRTTWEKYITGSASKPVAVVIKQKNLLPLRQKVFLLSEK